jgi:SAM-dependent methyltransferase
VLTLLTQIWTDAGWKEQRDEKLLGLPATVRAHPLFLEFLAREHQRRGEFSQALHSLEHAMQLVSDASEKARLRAEWHTVAAAQPQPSAEHAAGGLHRPEIPDRHPNLAAASLGQLTSEALYRARLGEFGSSEEAILLGLELDDALEHALDVHNNRFSIHRYADLFGSFYEWVGPPSPPLEGATVLDLGCGSLNPLGFLFLLLMLGARRGIAVDLETIHDWPRATTALGSLASAMLVAPQRVIGDRPIQAAQMLHNISSFDLAKLAAGDRTGIDPSRLVYRRESVHSLSLGSGEADVVVSNAFFEHIPSVDQAIAELARVTRPGGMGVHVIDCSDHRRYHDPLVHPLQFLTERHDGELAHGSNRLRPADFVNLFERNGFEVTEVNSFQQTALPNEIRSQLLEPYRSMSDEKLTDTIVKLVVRRRTS